MGKLPESYNGENVVQDIATLFLSELAQICPCRTLTEIGALEAVLIIGTDYRKIDNTLYRY